MLEIDWYPRIAKLGIGKYRIPNILNWLGVKIFNASKKFSRKLICTAMLLNPNNNAFEKNLDLFEQPSTAEQLDNLTLEALEKSAPKKLRNTHPEKINKIINYMSIFEGHKKLGYFCLNIGTDKSVKLTTPHVINSTTPVSPQYACEAKLPDTYIAVIEEAIVFGGTDLIIINKNIGLYDEIDKNEVTYYGNKCPIIENISPEKIQLKNKFWPREIIPTGIHLLKDHSVNYFHWLVECLPRLSLLNKLPNIDNIPLLVDRKIPPQSLEALRIIIADSRPIIIIDFQKAYLVKKLIYPSQLSVIHDNYNSPLRYDKDIVYSPEALQFTRNTILEKLKISPQQGFRKLFVSRKDAVIRKLLNSDEIENILISKGFEIVFPEKLSFISQVMLFSQAKIIVGQGGAGMANLIFAPTDCQILIMLADHPQTNLHVFAAIAQLLELSISFILGAAAKNNTIYSVHSDFIIDTNILLNYINNVI